MTSVLEALQHTPAHGRAEARWFVPGRIEVLGKHTDYAGGRSLLAAVDRGHTVNVRRVPGDAITVTSTLDPDTVRVPIDPATALARVPGEVRPGHWSGYVHTVVQRIAANFPGRLGGCEITISSNLPLAAGMSSSSALVVGIALALIDVFGLAQDPSFARAITSTEQLGEYLGTVENGQSFGDLTGERGVGTFGGSEDHTAMLCAHHDSLVQYAFCPVRHETTIPMPSHLAFVVAVSGVEAAKTGAARDAYNRVSLAARELVQLWNADTGQEHQVLAHVVAEGPAAVARLRHLAAADDYLPGRLEQFVAESEQIIPRAADALRSGDLAVFGTEVDRSHAHARTGLRNQVEETNALQTLARMQGAHAASAFGAGFGGSVWALVDADAAEAFAADWLAAYREEFPHRDSAFSAITRPGGAAHRLG